MLWFISTGRYRTLFPYKPDPMPSFYRRSLRSRIQNLNLFWGPQKFLGASEAEKKKKITTPPFFGQKIKWGSIFYEINYVLEFLLLNEVLKNWIFFQLPIQKSDFITLILSKFSILNANLWSICSKRFDFMVYTFICVF